MSTAPQQRVVVITGASQGIGRAITLRLAQDGKYKLALADRKVAQANLDKVVTEAKSAGAPDAAAFDCDVTQKAEVDALVEAVAKKFGTVDVMIANAGICKTEPFLETTLENLNTTHSVNVAGVLLSWQAAARQMIKQGHGGKLIAASSIAGIQGTPNFAAYSASKFAVRSLNQAAARELGPHGITCNVYCPGPIFTDMWSSIENECASRSPDQPKDAVTTQFESVSPLGRLGQPTDVANLVSFLVSTDSAYITGQAHQVDGGIFVS